MKTWTLREAAKRTSRSVTTLRRHIRTGRLRAEKRRGRFGPEYFVTDGALADAGLEVRALVPSTAALRRTDTRPAPPPAATAVPISLFQELQMKHEQLLVQYGMVRVGGMRVMELRAELETKQHALEASERRNDEQRTRFREETSRLKQLLRRVELEQEGRGLEVAALREKVRALEMLTRNSATNASIEKQFSEVMTQMRRVDRLATDLGEKPTDGPDH